MNRIAERFKILDEMIHATIDGVVRGMVVSGSGVGKTFGVEQVLEKDSLFDMMADKPLKAYIRKRYNVCYRSLFNSLQVF